MDEGDNVGVLLDRAGLAQVGEDGLFVAAALFGGAGELRQGEDGDVELFGESLEATGDGGDFLGAVLIMPRGGARGSGGHKLQIIDDHEVEAALGLAEAASFGAHFGEGDAGGVVDVDAGFDEALEGGGEFVAILAEEEAFLDFDRVDSGLGSEHAAEKGFLRHFQREDGHDVAVVDGGVLRDVDSEGGFAHGGPRGDDDELGLLEAAGHAIEFGEMGGEAGDLAAFLIEVVDGFEGAGDDVVHARKAAGDAFFGNFEERGFGGVEDFEGFFALVGGAGDGGGADVDELAEKGFVLDDADVFFDGEAAGQAFGEGGEPGDAADGFDFLAAGELFAEGDDVDDVVAVDELAHAGEDALMGGEGEVIGTEGGRGFAPGLIVEQDSAEDGALGVERGGQPALKFDIGGGGHGLQRV